MDSNVLADLVLIAHIIYVGFVVGGVVLVIAGGILRWPWVHNIWFRCIHLLMIAIVVAESLLGIDCPLTVWERALRPAKTGRVYEDPDFIAAWFDRILFYHFPHWVFTFAYLTFGLLIVSLCFFVPIRRRG